MGIEGKGEHLSDQGDVGLDNDAFKVHMRAILRAQERLSKTLHAQASLFKAEFQEQKQDSNKTQCDVSPGHRFFTSQL